MNSDQNSGSGFLPGSEIGEIDRANYCAAFLGHVLADAAVQISNSLFTSEVARNPQEAMRQMIVFSIRTGADSNLFIPSDANVIAAHPELFENREEAVPWEIVVEVAALFEVDANGILAEYIQGSLKTLASLGKLSGEGVDNLVQLKIAGENIDGIAAQIAEHLNTRMYSGKYVLHCSHDGHPCRHPYESLAEAVEAAVWGIGEDILESIGNITKGDEEVMSGSVLAERVAEALHDPREN